MKSKDNEKNITRRPRLSVVNSGVTKSKGYIPVPGLGDSAYLRATFSFDAEQRS